MDYPVGFALSLLAVLAGMAVAGVPLLKSLVVAIEGYKELRGDSMTRREKTKGWVGAAVWALVAVVIWSFFVDWGRAGNIDYAKDALAYRLEKIADSASRN